MSHSSPVLRSFPKFWLPNLFGESKLGETVGQICAAPNNISSWVLPSNELGQLAKLFTIRLLGIFWSSMPKKRNNGIQFILMSVGLVALLPRFMNTATKFWTVKFCQCTAGLGEWTPLRWESEKSSCRVVKESFSQGFPFSIPKWGTQMGISRAVLGASVLGLIEYVEMKGGGGGSQAG